MRILNLDTPNKIERRTVVRELQILTITHHFHQGVDMVDDLAAIVGVSPKKVIKWTETKTWHSALEFWGCPTDRKPYRDQDEKKFMEALPTYLRRSVKYWTRLIETGADIDPRAVEKDTGVRGENDYPAEIFGIETELPAGEVQND